MPMLADEMLCFLLHLFLPIATIYTNSCQKESGGLFFLSSLGLLKIYLEHMHVIEHATDH